MLKEVKKQLYLKKVNLLFNQGLKNKKIVPFDDNFYEKMNHTYFNGIPISMHIKYLKPLIPSGRCYDRSLYMFFCFPDALLCRGNIKYLELQNGEEYGGHGWIEMGEYVYDPTFLMRFDKELYYSILTPTNVIKYTVADYCSTKESKELYDNVTKTTIIDFQKPGIKRTDLITTIPLIKEIAKNSNNLDWVKELNEYLALINYDEQQIANDLDLAINKYR